MKNLSVAVLSSLLAATALTPLRAADMTPERALTAAALPERNVPSWGHRRADPPPPHEVRNVGGRVELCRLLPGRRGNQRRHDGDRHEHNAERSHAAVYGTSSLVAIMRIGMLMFICGMSIRVLVSI